MIKSELCPAITNGSSDLDTLADNFRSRFLGKFPRSVIPILPGLGLDEQASVSVSAINLQVYDDAA